VFGAARDYLVFAPGMRAARVLDLRASRVNSMRFLDAGSDVQRTL
jgi:hypothetical protein